MTLDDYPEFRPGQTLTAHELELLSAHLRHRDRRLGSVVGFGIAAGLAGRIDGGTLVIAPGLAVDQTGEALVLGEERRIDLSRLPTDRTEFSFVDARAGGHSVVLQATDAPQPPEPCPETGCAGHSALHRTGVALSVVPGRLTGTRLDLSTDPLFAAEPLLLSVTSQPVGSFVALRDAVVARLRTGGGRQPLIAAVLVDDIARTSIAASDPAATKAYKAGWLNEVFFACLDLVRVEALLALGLPPEGTPPGVVLGHVRRERAGWVLDCAWRHAWQPPRGQVEALLGGTCADPARFFRDRVEALVAAYGPPAPPSSGGTGWIPIDPILDIDLYTPVFPPERWVVADWPDLREEYAQLPDLWGGGPWTDPRTGPRTGPGGLVTDPLVLYGRTADHVLDQGPVLGTGRVIGFTADSVAGVLREEIAARGGVGGVEVVTAAQVRAVDGYRPSGELHADDRLVLTVDAEGLVVATGIVPAAHEARRTTALRTQTTEAVAEVAQVAASLRSLADGVEQRIGGVDAVLDTVRAEMRGTMAELRTELTTSLAGTREEVTMLKERTAALPQMARQLEQVTELDLQQRHTAESLAFVYGVIGESGPGRKPFGTTGEGVPTRPRGGYVFEKEAPGTSGLLTEFTQTLVEALETVPEGRNPNLPRYVRALRLSQGRFEMAVASLDAAEVGEAMYDLLDTMRTAVKAAGIDPALAPRIDAQVRRMKEHLG